MFSRHRGGEEVAGGAYWNLNALEFTTVPQGGGRLPGEPTYTYIQTPTAVVLIAAPILGASLALFLPLSGMIVLAWAVLRRVSPSPSTRPVAREAPAEPAPPAQPAPAPERARDEEMREGPEEEPKP